MKMKNFPPAQTNRRQMIGILGAAGVVALVGCGDDDSSSSGSTEGAGGTGGGGSGDALSCVVRPSQAEGPYFIDEGLDRSDIRSDPSDGLVKEGVPLRLKLGVHRLDGSACTPVAGAVVDVWQCDAEGVYSDVVDMNGLFDTTGKKFLRGSQVTDEDGTAEFLTIYPGWYEGRTVHIHIKVRTDPGSQSGYEFTSQVYFDEAITDEVLAQAPYNAKGPRQTKNTDDAIFQDERGEELILELTKDGDGYASTFNIGLQIA